MESAISVLMYDVYSNYSLSSTQPKRFFLANEKHSGSIKKVKLTIKIQGDCAISAGDLIIRQTAIISRISLC